VATNRATILLVDDDLDIRESIRDVLEEEGYSVLAAANGAEALEALPALRPPCVVLLDLMMPVMDGWQFLEEARNRGLLKNVPVVVLTASREFAVPTGASELVRKPVGLDDLLAAVARHITG
jgi:CheY-like chemotaxis protein